METIQFQLHINNVMENEATLNSALTNEMGLNLNQKRTLRKAATNFSLTDDKLYYIGKTKKDKRLVILDEEGKKQIFEDCHGSTTNGEHGGQKKTLEKIESLFFWRGMVKDVINWIQTCEVCRQKDEKRGQLNKKLKKISFCDSDHSTLCINDSLTVENSLSNLFEAAKFNIDQIELSLKQIQCHENEVNKMSKQADLDIDDVLDFFMSKIMKMISKKKRLMKAQVEEFRIRSLASVKECQKQLEGRLKIAKKVMSDVEKARRENQTSSSLLQKSVLNMSLPELPLKEDIGGVWTTFQTEVAQTEIEQIIMFCGSICGHFPFRISSVLELPGSLRLNLSYHAESLQIGKPKSLRLYHCLHDAATSNFDFDNDRIQLFDFPSAETSLHLDHLEPRQVYAVYISHREEGASDWSPWSFPLLASTAIAGYSWDTNNNDWDVTADLKETMKMVESTSQLYSSSAQFFPGCRISFTIHELPQEQDSDDGFALIDQWVSGGSWSQEGTLFINTKGKLFINGKFEEEFKPLTLGSTVTFDCHPRIETVEDGLRLQFTISCQNTSHLVYWSVRNHITNVYFGVRFQHQGARIKIE